MKCESCKHFQKLDHFAICELFDYRITSSTPKCSKFKKGLAKSAKIAYNKRIEIEEITV